MEALEPGTNGLPSSWNLLILYFLSPLSYSLPSVCLGFFFFFLYSRLANENKFVAISYSTKHTFSNSVAVNKGHSEQRFLSLRNLSD